MVSFWDYFKKKKKNSPVYEISKNNKEKVSQP